METQISLSQLGRYISGRNLPKVEKLLAIATVTGVDLGWLASGKGEMLRGGAADGLTPDEISMVVERVEACIERADIAANSNTRSGVAHYLSDRIIKERSLQLGGSIDDILETILAEKGLMALIQKMSTPQES